MMVYLKWIKMFSSMIPMLQYTAAGIKHSDFFIRDGGEVTFPCKTAKADQHECERTTWLFSNSTTTEAATLFEHGKLHDQNKPDTLSVTANCSLVIKKVTFEDVGRYTCRKFSKSGTHKRPDFVSDLYLVKMTEHKEDNTVTLNCSVLPFDGCQKTVKWLYEDKDVAKEHKDLKTSQSACSSSVTFTTSHNVYTSKNGELLKCQMINGETMEEFAVRIPPPVMETVSPGWWKFIAMGAGLAALIISTVIIIRWKRAKGNKLQRSQSTADPEDAVFYATVTFTNNTSKTRVLGKHESEEYGAVTYSMVKASSSSGASADPSKLPSNHQQTKK